ncbi:hypothetical protein S245_001901, partial [Arachis hypogaea]
VIIALLNVSPFKCLLLNVAVVFNIPYMLDTPKGKVKNPDFLNEVSSVCNKEEYLIVDCQ